MNSILSYLELRDDTVDCRLLAVNRRLIKMIKIHTNSKRNSYLALHNISLLCNAWKHNLKNVPALFWSTLTLFRYSPATVQYLNALMGERSPHIPQMNCFVDYQLSRKSKTECKIHIHSSIYSFNNY